MPTLSWLTREKDVKCADGVAYRLLERDDGLGVGSPESGNMLIQGDNLEALKSLLPYYRGQVKCIYIDPPYNTRSAFEHYDDNLEHSQWLAMIWPRLVLLRELLAEDGSIWVSIDDNEGHYLKVIMDEVFGRRNFVTTCTWQQRTTRENRKVFSEDCERLIVYCRNPEIFKSSRNDLPLTEAVKSRYVNYDNDDRGPWQSVSLNAQGGHGTPNQFYEFISPNGTHHSLPSGRCWLYTWPEMQKKIADGRVWFGKSGNNAPREKKFLAEARAGLTPNTLWLADDVGTNDHAKKEIVTLFGASVFDTPKPERLMERIIHIATNPGDLVIDSFLGSGTTAAVAHKMGRRWIGIEMGDHALTHCAPRLRKVINGEQGGISKAVGWNGGGDFAFYRLGEAVFDGDGAINPGISFAPLAAHIWFSESGLPFAGEANTPFLGEHDGTGLALLYNGILGDKRVSGGNVLTRKTLAMVRAAAGPFSGPITIYGEASRLSPETLRAEGINFKQTPYDVKAR
jgi:adenine-specific DNA-methyltransferase